MERRRFLALGGAALTTSAAGCSTEGAEDPENERGDGSGNDNGTGAEIRDHRYVDPIETPTPTRTEP